MDKDIIINGLADSAMIRGLVSEIEMPYALIPLCDFSLIDIEPAAIERMAAVMASTGASMVYSDYWQLLPDGALEAMDCIDRQPGALRDDFDFGAAVLVDSNKLKSVVDDFDSDYRFAAWYVAWLGLSRLGPIVHIPERLYTLHSPADDADGESQHFSYVDPRNRDVQLEKERACTAHLKALGAWLPPRHLEVDFGDGFPVEASVVIPVKNRVDTIGDAIFSALEQQTDFEFNVIVVDNHSTDGTTDVVNRLADDPRVVHVIPSQHTLGIGGCWNLAINHPRCGRFAIQLDSDDIYSGRDTVQKMVDCFYAQRCAMVVGSYSLTDFNLAPLPPGVIDHREWTDANGHNNLLRVNGVGAPRAFAVNIARRFPMPDVSYGEDYAMALRISRDYRIGRIFDVLYYCRRWEGNSDASLTREKANRFNFYKDRLRSWELVARIQTEK
ncbi:MAG: glycosyltransferase [Bacteroides sp.]|nr:glycosyltransferase [Bacteroides sp.]MCM1413655.1 glycosyltransferase [Bacteroides sp.]MCM1471834.1 glycosyltransferase [Bacteroides sp.]